MTRRAKIAQLRHVADLCYGFARNMAYYRATRGKRGQGNFWTTVRGNFIDMATLEWCKLFGGRSEKHRWQSIVTDKAAFETALHEHLKWTADEYAAKVKAVLDYRDQFLVHLDIDKSAVYPLLTKMRKAVEFYFKHVVENEMTEAEADSIGIDLRTYYKNSAAEAERIIAPPPAPRRPRRRKT